MRIQTAFKQANTDKHASHDYDRYYQMVFDSYTPKSLLEIGVQTGRSLLAWSMVFPDCKITGVDITEAKFQSNIISLSGADIIIADSTKPDIKDKLDQYDVIIDDGSHFYKDILRTFNNLKDKFNDVYIIEDLMYRHSFVKKYVERLGYTCEMYPSKTRQVPVNTNWLRHNEYKGDHKTVIDLYFCIIRRAPIQTV